MRGAARLTAAHEVLRGARGWKTPRLRRQGRCGPGSPAARAGDRRTDQVPHPQPPAGGVWAPLPSRSCRASAPAGETQGCGAVRCGPEAASRTPERPPPFKTLGLSGERPHQHPGPGRRHSRPHAPPPLWGRGPGAADNHVLGQGQAPALSCYCWLTTRAPALRKWNRGARQLSGKGMSREDCSV